MKALIGALAVTVGLTFAVAAHATVLYSNDFETGSTAGLTGVTTITTAPSGEHFLGHLSLGDTSTLNLNTSGYGGVSLSFQLYTIQSLDGVNSGYYLYWPDGDTFRLRINGVTVSAYSYANCCFSQTNPASPDDTSHLGYNFYGPDHTYNMNFSLGSGPTTIDFIGRTDQGPGDESFGVDNIVVSGVANTGVPEPASWALMILGFGGVGAALRNRRRVFAAI